MRKRLYKLIKQLFCRHYSRTHIKTDYNEGVVLYDCLKCGKRITIEMECKPGSAFKK